MTGGQVRVKRVGLPPGHPLRPLTAEERVTKVRECAAQAVRRLPAAQVSALAKRVESLERMTDVGQLMRLIVA